MKFLDFAHGTIKTLAVILVLALGVSAPAKTKFKVLYNFTGGKDGGGPVYLAALAVDKSGNLFGGAENGGYDGYPCPYGCGGVFEMTPGNGGKWIESMLFEITDPESQGWFVNSPIALDRQGDLYGCDYRGPMFELTPDAALQWTFNVIWRSGCVGPVGLIVDDAGNLYGEFGNGNSGGVSELSPSSGGWVYTNLYEFCQQQGCPDGYNPEAPFTWDATANLYGTTYWGGQHNDGVAFQMAPNGDGTWTYHVMHRFGSFHGDGCLPGGSLTIDATGNAYGTTTLCGPHSDGTVFKLTPRKGGHWKETVLYGFPSINTGVGPTSNLVLDKAGNLYGTAGWKGCNYTCGLVFKLSPQKDGKWNYTVLHKFNETDGDLPNGLTMGSQGRLYGTTSHGGKYGYGVVFELTL